MSKLRPEFRAFYKKQRGIAGLSRMRFDGNKKEIFNIWIFNRAIRF